MRASSPALYCHFPAHIFFGLLLASPRFPLPLKLASRTHSGLISHFLTRYLVYSLSAFYHIHALAPTAVSTLVAEPG